MNLGRRSFLGISLGALLAPSSMVAAVTKPIATATFVPVTLAENKISGMIYVTQELLDDCWFDINKMLDHSIRTGEPLPFNSETFDTDPDEDDHEYDSDDDWEG